MKELIAKRNQLLVDLQTILDAAKTEKRDMSGSENEQFDRISQDVEGLDAQIERHQKYESLSQRAALPINEPVRETGTVEPTTEARAAFERYLRTGQVRAMTVGTGSEGGVMAPADFYRTLVTALKEASPIRALSTVIETSLKSIVVPVQTTGVTASWVGETAAASATQPVFTSVTIPVRTARAYTPVTNDLISDAAFNVLDVVGSAFVSEFARIEGHGFINGTAAGNAPSGILDVANNGITPVNSGTSADFAADDLIDLFYSLAQTYQRNAVWLMNSATLKKAMKFKDDSGRYLWDAGVIAGGQGPTLFGRPYFVLADVPATGTANALSVVCADLKAGYRVVTQAQNAGIALKRDEYTDMVNNNVRIHGFMRVGGAVVLPEAIKIIKEAA